MSEFNTVSAPIKDTGSIQKLFFQPYIMVPFTKFCLFFTKHDYTKFSYNTPIFGNILGAVTMQERPLLAQVR